MPERPSDVLLAHYKEIRDYIKHEDHLISDRTSSTLLAHGFLIASYALLLQSRIGATAQCQGRDAGCVPRSAAALANPEKYGKASPEAVAALFVPDQLLGFLSLADVILPVIALIGVFTTMSALRAVRAAEISINSIREYWTRFSIDCYGNLDERGLPPVTGGWAEEVNTKYRSIPRALLRILLLMWWVIVAISAFVVFIWHKDALTAWIDLSAGR